MNDEFVWLEETKNRLAIRPHIHQLRVVQKVVVRIVLQHKEPVGQQQVFFKNQVGNGINRRQRVGRPGENVVELRTTMFDKMKYVHLLDGQLFFNAERLCRLAHETHSERKIVHIRHILTAPRNELIAVAARAAEQVEHFRLLEINQVIQNIEQRLLGHIRRGTGRPVVRWGIETSPF